MQCMAMLQVAAKDYSRFQESYATILKVNLDRSLCASPA